MWVGSPLLAAVFLSPAEAAYGVAVKGLPLLGTCAVFFALNITASEAATLAAILVSRLKIVRESRK